MIDEPVYVTRPLLAGLLELASDRDPDAVSVPLSAQPSDDLEPADGKGVALSEVPPQTPVFAGFTFPNAGGAVNFVFGMELGHPARTAGGRFVSHPDADPDLSSRDDLATRMLVAIPPWEIDDVRAYDRNGRRHPLRTVAAVPPDEEFDPERAERL